MSAIGEYVHYTAYGYSAFGIDRIQKGQGLKRTVPTLAMNIQKEKIRQQASSLELNKLQDTQGMERQIEALMKKPSSDAANEGLRLAWEIICEQLRIDFYDEVPSQIMQDTGQVKTTVSKMGGTKSGHFLSTYLTKINDINTLISQIKSGENENKIKGILDSIISDLSGISNIGINQIKNFLGCESSIEAKQFLEKLRLKNELISNEKAKSIIDNINKAVNLAKGLSNYVKGEMFQLLIAISQLKKEELTRENIQKAIEECWVGNKKTGVYLKSTNFAKGTDLSSSFKGPGQKVIYGPNGEIESYVSGYSSDKIDVIYNYKGKPYNASLKNVNLYAYPYISLVTGASLLALMQSMDYDFVNHYLNIMATHYRMPPGSEIEQPIFNQASIRNLAREAMDISLLLAAFIGHKLDADTADIFIVNNNAAGKGDPQIKVFNIGELVLRAINSIDTSFSPINVEMSSSGEGYLNNFAPTIEQRLSTLLQQVHSIIVKVSLDNSILNMTH